MSLADLQRDAQRREIALMSRVRELEGLLKIASEHSDRKEARLQDLQRRLDNIEAFIAEQHAKATRH